MNIRLIKACCFLVTAAAATVDSRAQFVTNPDFEAGLSGWSTTGDVSAQLGSYGITPASGLMQAALTTDQSKTLSVTGLGVVSAAAIEQFLGLASGSLTGAGNGVAIEGSALKQTISVLAGQTLSFSYNFVTDERKPDPANDFGFLSVVPTTGVGNQLNVSTLANGQTWLAAANAGTTLAIQFNSPAQIKEFRDLDAGPALGYKTFTHTFLTSGEYVLGFGVVDVGDNLGTSGLMVDNLSLTAVPEPKSWALIAGLSLGALAAVKRFRRPIYLPHRL